MTDSDSRLRLTLRQPDGSLTPILPGTAAELDVVDFVALAANARFSGRIRLDAERLSDMLNAHAEFELQQARAEEIGTGRWRIVSSVVLRRDELLVVLATGPRGSLLRRRHTIPRTLTVKLGRYIVTGEVHTEPGLDPLLQLKRRDMVPLTDAVVRYEGPRGTIEEPVDAVVINRHRIDWARRSGVLA